MSRVDTRLNAEDVMKGVVLYGGGRIHGIQTETVFRRLAYCGRPVQNASGSAKPLSCPDCIHYLRSIGYAV